MFNLTLKYKSIRRIMALVLTVIMVMQLSTSAFAISTPPPPNTPPESQEVTSPAPTPENPSDPNSNSGASVPESPVEIPPIGETPPIEEAPPVDVVQPPISDTPIAPEQLPPENNLPLGLSNVTTHNLPWLTPDFDGSTLTGETYQNINSETEESILQWRDMNEQMRNELIANNDWTYGDPQEFILTQEIMNQLMPQPYSMDEVSNIRKFSAQNHVLVYTQEGKLFGWGDNTKGQLGNLGSTVTTPTEITFFRDKGPIVSICAGTEFSMVVTMDNSIWVVGALYYSSGSTPLFSSREWTKLPVNNFQGTITSINSYIPTRAAPTTIKTPPIIVSTEGPSATHRLSLDYYSGSDSIGLGVYNMYENQGVSYASKNTQSITILGTTNFPKVLNPSVTEHAQISVTSGSSGVHTYAFHRHTSQSNWNTSTSYGNFKIIGFDLCEFKRPPQYNGYPEFFYLPAFSQYTYLGKPVRRANKTVFVNNIALPTELDSSSGTAYYRLSLSDAAVGENEFMCGATGFRLLPDGRIEAKGINEFGKSGTNQTGLIGYSYVQGIPAGLIKYIEGRGDTAFFLGSDGSIYAAGSNRLGQLGQGPSYMEIESRVPVKIDLGFSMPKTISTTQSSGGTIVADKTTAKKGETVTVSATANSGYKLVPGTLKYNGIAINGSTFIMPDANVTITAQFSSVVYSISVYATPNGTVSLSQPSAAPGTTITVTPRPNSGYRLRAGTLKYNSIPVTGNSFSMPNGNVTVSAEFELTPYSISIGSTPGGSIVAGSSTAQSGSAVTVTAVPSNGYQLNAGSLKYNGNPINGNSFIMPASNVTLTATFSRIVYNVTVLATPNGSISIDKSSAAPGTVINVTVNPSSGFRVRAATLSYNSIPISGSSFRMPDGAVTVTAEFERIPYTITVTQAPNGSIQSSSYTAYPGDTVSLLITPLTGYALKANTLKFNGTTIAGSSFTMPSGNVTVTGEFEASAYAISVHPAANGVVSVDKSSAKPGNTVTVSATADQGFALKASGITVNNSPITGNSFVMPYSSVSVTALFEPIYYSVVAQPSSDGVVSVSKSLAIINEAVTINVTPNAGYKLKDGGITVNGSPINSTTFKMPNANVSVSATFEPIPFQIMINNSSEGVISVNKVTAFAGETVTVNTFPKEGYRVRTGSLKYDSTAITGGQFKMPTNDTTITCEYDVIYNDINVIPPANGTLTASMPKATLGTTIQTVAIPNKGYSLEYGGVTVNNSPVDGNTFLMPSTSVTLVAKFDPIMYKIETQSSTMGKIVASKTEGIVNELIELSIMPNEGYRVRANSLKVNGVVRDADNFIMPAANVLVTVDFEPVQFPITIQETLNGKVKTDRTTAKIGDIVKIQITPDNGYQYEEGSLRVNGDLITARQFTMTAQDTVVAADFEAINYTVDVKQTANGEISVLKSIAHINDVITIEANPDVGYTLVNGSLRVNGVTITGNSFVMPAGNAMITGTFEPIVYTVTMNTVDNGKITSSNSTATVDKSITVSVHPNTGYQLVSGSLKVDGNVIVDNKFNMTAKNAIVTCAFEPIVYSVETLPTTNGKLLPDKPTAVMNEKVTVSNLPEEGYRLVNGSLTVNSIPQYGNTFVMPPSQAAINAMFEPLYYAINIKEVKNGTVTANKLTGFIGQDVSVTVTPDKGYRYKEGTLMLDGNIIKDNTFKMPANVVYISCEMEPIVYKINREPIQNGRITTDLFEATIGKTVKITPIPNVGYQLVQGSVEVNSSPVSQNTFTMPANDVNVNCQFEPVYYSVISNTIEHGKIITDKSKAFIGQDIKISVNPDKGYRLKEGSLKADDKLVIDGTVKMPAADIAITCELEPIVYNVGAIITENGMISTNISHASIGDEILITTLAAPGYQLVAGSLKMNGLTVTGSKFNMPAENAVVSASFEPIYYKVSVKNPNHGRISIDKYTSYIGEEVKIEVSTEDGYQFKAGSLRANGETVVGWTTKMPATDLMISCELEPIVYKISTEQINNGKLTTDVIKSTIGSIVTITAHPDSGYALIEGSLKVNKTSISKNSFIMPTEDVIVSGTFEPVVYSVDVIQTPNGTTTVDKYNATIGQKVTLTTTPDKGFKLKENSIRINGVTSDTHNFTMPANKTKVTAEYENIVYNINVTANDHGKFIVSKTTGILNERINITPVPALGYRYVQGSITINDIQQYGESFIMPANTVTISGAFELIVYPIELPQPDNGTTSASILNAKMGDIVKIYTKPNKGFRIKENSITVNGDVNKTNEFVMPAEKVTIMSTYENIVYTINTPPSANGKVIPIKTSGIYGEYITVSTLPDTGYRYVPGTITVNGIQQSRESFNMPAETVEITGQFELIVYPINVEQTSHGTTNVSQTSGKMGETVKITTTPDKGFRVKESSVIVNEEINTKNEFIMPANDVSIKASYENIVYDIEIIETPNGKISVSKTSAHYNDIIQVIPLPDAGYRFVTGSMELSGVTQYGESFTMPSSDVTVSMSFDTIDYSVNTIQSEGGSISVDKYNATVGQEVKVIVKPDRGYKLSDGALKLNEKSIADNKFIMPSDTANLTVAFEKIVYEINLKSPSNGTATVDKIQATYNEDVTVSMKPADGYMVGPSTLKLNGIAISGNSFKMPDSNSSVVIDFANINYTLEPNNFNGGRISFNKSYADVGDEIEVITEPNSGYRYVKDSIRINGSAITGLKFKMPARNVKAEARFEASSITATVTDPTNMAIAGIEVIIESAFYSDRATSNSNGIVNFKLVPNGKFKVRTNDYIWSNTTVEVEFKEGLVVDNDKIQLIIDRDRSVENVEKEIEKLPQQTASSSVVMSASSSIFSTKRMYDALNPEQKKKVKEPLADKLRILFAKVTKIDVEVLSSLSDVRVTDVELSINKEQYVNLESSIDSTIRLQVFVNPIEEPTPEEEILASEKISASESVYKFLDISIFQKLANEEPTPVDQLNKPITVSVGLQEIETGAKYKVVRLHDGEATLLPTTLKDSTITFRTDKFSTYAIITTAKGGLVSDADNSKTLFWERIIRKVQGSGPWDIVNEDISGQDIVPVAVVQTINDWTGEIHFTWDGEAFMLSGKNPIQVMDQRMFYTVQELIELSKKRTVVEEVPPVVVVPPLTEPSIGQSANDYESFLTRMEKIIGSSISSSLPNGLMGFMTGKQDVNALDVMAFIFVFTLFAVMICVAVILLAPTAKLMGVRLADDLSRKIKHKKKRKSKLTKGFGSNLTNAESGINKAAESVKAIMAEKAKPFVTKTLNIKRWTDKFKDAIKVPETTEVVDVQEDVVEPIVEVFKDFVEIDDPTDDAVVYTDDIIRTSASTPPLDAQSYKDTTKDPAESHQLE